MRSYQRGVVMRAMFIDILSDEAASARPLPEVVRTYIDGGGDDQDARDMRRFQLARALLAIWGATVRRHSTGTATGLGRRSGHASGRTASRD